MSGIPGVCELHSQKLSATQVFGRKTQKAPRGTREQFGKPQQASARAPSRPSSCAPATTATCAWTRGASACATTSSTRLPPRPRRRRCRCGYEYGTGSSAGAATARDQIKIQEQVEHNCNSFCSRARRGSPRASSSIISNESSS